MFPTKLLFFLVVLSTQSFALPTGQLRQEVSAVNARDSDFQNSIGTITKNKRDNEIDIEARAPPDLSCNPALSPGRCRRKRDVEIEARAAPRVPRISNPAIEAGKKIFGGGKRDLESDLLERGLGDVLGAAPGVAKKFKDKINGKKNKRQIEIETGIPLEARAMAKLPAAPRKAGEAAKKIFGGGKKRNLENDLTSRGVGDIIDKVVRNRNTRNRNKNKRDMTGIALEARAVPKAPGMGGKAAEEFKKIFGGGKKRNLENDLASRGVGDIIDKVGGAPGKMRRTKDAIRNRNKNKRGLEIEARAGGAKAGAGGAKNGAGGAGGAKAGAGGAQAGATGKAAAAGKKAGGGAGGAKAGAGGAKVSAGGAKVSAGGAKVSAGGAQAGATGKAAAAAKKAGGGKKRDLEPEA